MTTKNEIRATWAKTTTTTRVIAFKLHELLERCSIVEHEGEATLRIKYKTYDGETGMTTLRGVDATTIEITITTETVDESEPETETF